MDDHSWEMIKSVLNWVIYPLLCGYYYFFQKKLGEMDAMKLEIAELKISQAVAKSQINDLRDDIKDLSKTIKDAEYNISQEIKSLQKEVINGRNRGPSR